MLRPGLPPLKPHIYCCHFICAVSAGAGSRAHRVWISAYIGQFYRLAIFVPFCIFPCPLSPARLQGRSLCEHTANSGAKVWYTARFCAILDKKSTQPGRAAPGTKGATHEKHHRGKTRGHPQQRQPDAAGGHRRTFAGFMDLLACSQAERLLHRHSGMHVSTDIFDYAAYIWAAYQLCV